MDAFFFICEYLEITPASFFDTETETPAKLHAILSDMKHRNDNQPATIADLVHELTKK